MVYAGIAIVLLILLVAQISTSKSSTVVRDSGGNGFDD